MASDTLHLPDDTNRITIIGKTGSGKTQGALWQLAQRSYTSKPWVVLNWKYDELLDAIPGSQQMKVNDAIPKRPGIYIVHPGPQDAEAVDALMWRIWQRENTGLFVDEGYMIAPRSPAYQALLTQGRSKHTPVITLTQRPAWISRFAFSEADYIQLFQLSDTRDIKMCKQFMPLPIDQTLPGPYYSWWWDNARDHKAVLRPVPERDIILDTFRSRLKPDRKAF